MHVGGNWHVHEPGDCDALDGKNIKSVYDSEVSHLLFRSFFQTLDEAVAWNLNAHVMGTLHSMYDDHQLKEPPAGYEFLMQNCTYRFHGFY